MSPDNLLFSVWMPVSFREQREKKGEEIEMGLISSLLQPFAGGLGQTISNKGTLSVR